MVALDFRVLLRFACFLMRGLSLSGSLVFALHSAQPSLRNKGSLCHLPSTQPVAASAFEVGR